MAEYINRKEALHKISINALSPIAEVYKAVEVVPVADVQPVRWIPVSEQLPDSKTEVLVYYEWVGRSGEKYKEIEILTFDEVYKSSITPIAWMPFPEPPKEDT